MNRALVAQRCVDRVGISEVRTRIRIEIHDLLRVSVPAAPPERAYTAPKSVEQDVHPYYPNIAILKRKRHTLAVSVPDFPHLLMLNGPNGPVGNFSLIDVAEPSSPICCSSLTSGSGRLPRSLRKPSGDGPLRDGTCRGGQDHGVGDRCRSWYLDDRGVPAAWPWSFTRFREAMAHPVLDDYELV